MDQIDHIVGQLKSTQKSMMDIQGDALLYPDRWVLFFLSTAFSYIYTCMFNARDFESQLQKLYASCTKLDVTLNNYIVRSKYAA